MEKIVKEGGTNVWLARLIQSCCHYPVDGSYCNFMSSQFYELDAEQIT
jgi:hypothetical protein